MNMTFLFGLGTPEILLIAVVILLFFGAKRIPDLMKSMGKGVRSFKEGMKSIENELNEDSGPDSGESSEKKEK